MSIFSQILKPVGMYDAAGNGIGSNAGALDVYVTGGSFSITVGNPDKTIFTYGVSPFLAVGGVYQDTAPQLTAGQSGSSRLTAYRGLHVNLRDSSGVELLGQHVMADSVPVVIASDQSTLPISAASLPLPTGAATSALQSSILTALGSPFQAGGSIGNTAFGISGSLPAGSNAIGSVSVSNFPATQPISGTVTVVQSTGSNLHVDVDNFPATQAISAVSLPLPTGAATSALQSTISGQLPTSLGQKVSASSLAVVIASDQSAIPVSGTVSITGVATAANQTNVQSAPGTSANTALTIQGSASGVAVPISGTVTITPSGTQSINMTEVGGSAISLGQTTMSTSLPVTIASNQSALAISAASLPLPTGAATKAELITINTTLGSPFQAGGSIGNTSFAVTQATASNLNATVVGTGTAGTPSGGVLTVQGSASGTPQPITQSTPAALTIHNGAITVGTTAVRLTVSGSAPSATRVVLVATPDTASTATFYIGGSSVTNSGSTRGIEIVSGQSFIANSDAGDYYIVSSTASQTVTVMEQY